MKSSSTIILAVATVFASMTLVSCRDVTIPAGELPMPAQTFLKEYFPEHTVSYVMKDVDLLKTTYEVTLQDGTEIDFKSKGEWDKVDCKMTAVPAPIVPAPIAQYVQTSFPGQVIVKIDKERRGYDIELANDLELKFSKNGRLREVDD